MPEPLFLSARHVAAPLFDICIVFVGESLDKVVRAGEFARVLDLFVRRVRLAPAQIFFDGPRKQDVLLQDHGDFVAQRLDIVIFDVDAAHVDSALRRVVKARDQIDERGFGSTCAA